MLQAWGQPALDPPTLCHQAQGFQLPSQSREGRRLQLSYREKEQAWDSATKAFCSPNSRLISALSPELVSSGSATASWSRAICPSAHPVYEMHLLLLSGAPLPGM